MLSESVERVGVALMSHSAKAERARLADARAGAGELYKAGEVLVVFQNDVRSDEIEDIVQSASDVLEVDADIQIVEGSLEDGAAQASVGEAAAGETAVLEVADTATVAEAIAQLEADERVAYAQPNYIYTLNDLIPIAVPYEQQETLPDNMNPSDSGSGAEALELETLGAENGDSTLSGTYAATDDPARSYQWYLNSIGAYEAWDSARCDNGVTVAVIDTGIAMDHPDLKDNIVAPRDMVGDNRDDYTASVPDDSPDDEMGHGTHVAGIACARSDNGIGIAGVSGDANVLPIKVFYRSSSIGDFVCETKDILAAYNYLLGDAADGSGQTVAQRNNVRVINMSLGDRWLDDAVEDNVVLDAIDEAKKAGIITVCAAGNDEFPIPYKNWPSDYEGCISVTALSSDSELAYFSNYGPEKDIAAPGASIYSTMPANLNAGEDYGYMSGTSMASPVVAGVAALCWAANPTLTPEQVENVLYSTAVDIGEPGKDEKFGYGRVNAAAAVLSARGINNIPVESISGFPTKATVAEPLALYGIVSPAEANQNIVFSLKDAGSTGAAVSKGIFLAGNAGTAVVAATVIGGAADGSNFVCEFTIDVDPSESTVWNGLSDTSWYNTIDTEFYLSTPQQLAGLAAIASGSADGIAQDTFYGKTVTLTQDIYLNTAAVDSRTSGMREWKPIADINGAGANATDIYFDGTFDGNGHIINNIYIDGVTSDEEYGGYQGLFGALGENAAVLNLGLEGGWIFGRVAGGIAACSHVSTSDKMPRIVSCYNNTTIENYGSSSRGAGGIFGGENQAGGHYGTADTGYRGGCYISNCYNRGTIKGYVGSPAGGIAGIGSVVITGCYNVGNIISGSTMNVGSIAGVVIKAGSEAIPSGAARFIANGTVENSYGTVGTSAFKYWYMDAEYSSIYNCGFDSGLTPASVLQGAAGVLGSAFLPDDDNQNGGFPLLYWQKDASTFDISNAVIMAIADQFYSGEPIVPDLTVYIVDPSTGSTNPVKLVKGSDYMVTATNNVDVGTATVTVTGVGRYSGSASKTFKIVRIDLSQCVVTAPGAMWFYGDVATPSIVVTTPSGTTLRAGVHYRLELSTEDGTKAEFLLTGLNPGITGTAVVSVQLEHASDSLKGNGSEDDPYLIATKADLQFMAKMVNEGHPDFVQAEYKVVNDIDASSNPQSPLSVDPVGMGSAGFGGVFDGAGHSITVSLAPETISADLGFDPAFRTLALFGSLKSDTSNPVVIRNLTLNGSVTTSGEGAGFVGAALAPTVVIEGCVNNASVKAGFDCVGAGFVVYTGADTNLSMSNCINNATVDGDYIAAGLVGELSGTGEHRFVDCGNNGNITMYDHGGGIVGAFYPTVENSFTIERSYNTGSIIATSTGVGVSSAGGILGSVQPSYDPGFKTSRISSSFNTGDIKGGYAAGGIVGRLYYLPVDFAGVYNTGDVVNGNTSYTQPVCRAGDIVGMVAYANTWRFASVYNTGNLVNLCGLNNGAIVGYMFYDTVAEFDHVYYAGDVDAIGELSDLLRPPVLVGTPEKVSSEQLKDMAADLGSIFLSDSDSSVNEGYPILYWQKDDARLSIEDAAVESISAVCYTGMPIVPSLTVTLDGQTLVAGSDYLLECSDNIVPGTASVTIVGAGRFEGSLSTTFEIVKGNLDQGSIEQISSQLYTGEAVTPSIVVRNAEGFVLDEGIDYTLEFKNNVEVGQADVVARGVGFYEGSLSSSFEIVATKDLGDAYVSALSGYTYTGAPITPSVTVRMDGVALVRDVDYTVTYLNNVNVGTATVLIDGIGGYTGGLQGSFAINPAGIGSAQISTIANQTYTGSAIEPPIEVKLNGNVLEAGVDYVASYQNNVVEGIATVVATGCGNYTGSRSATFLIVPAAGGTEGDGEAGSKPSEPSNPSIPGADAVLSVYVQQGDDESTKELSASLTKAQLEALAAPVTSGGYIYSSDGKVRVITAHQGVTIDALLSRAGLVMGSGDSLIVSDPISVHYACTYQELRDAAYFWPSYMAGSFLTAGKASVPPVIALSWTPVDVTTTAGAAFTEGKASMARQNILRFMIGVSEEDYVANSFAGMRFINNVASITLVKGADVSGGNATGGGHGSEGETPGENIDDDDNPLAGPSMDSDTFVDVDESDWFYDTVKYAYENSIVTGYEDGTNRFDPYGATTRAQVAVMLYRLCGAPEVDADDNFIDVMKGQYYTDALAWAKQTGVSTGYGTTGLFGPNDLVTREQLATMLHRFAKTMGFEIVAGSDLSKLVGGASVTEYAQEAMAWANAAGLITGFAPTGDLAPLKDASRCEVATIMARFHQVNIASQAESVE